mgnify:CR=1 FL=1
MEVPFFESKCNDCGNNYVSPALSDFEYGQLIASFEKSEDYFVVKLLNNPVMGFISKTRDKLSTRTVQQVVASCADQAIDSNITIKSSCPACGSEDVVISTGKKESSTNLEVASYNRFLSLDDREKTKLIDSKVGKMI